MNIYEIAKMAGVSIATVSRALNGGPVNDKTKKHILKIIEQTNYRPNAYARAMTQNSLKLAGILVSDINDLYYAKAVYTLEKKLAQMDYEIVLYSAGSNLQKTHEKIHMMISRKIDALFVIGSKFKTVEDEICKNGLPSKLPVIGINLETEDKRIYNVLADDAAAMADTVGFLVKKGHKGFIYLYSAETQSGYKKLQGFKDGIRKNNLALKNQVIVQCCPQFSQIKSHLSDTLKTNPHITAVITSDDDLAICVLKSASALDIPVPGRLAVTGYDNSIISNCSTPEITSVDNKVELLCEIGVEIFSNIINKKAVAQRHMVSCEIMEKQTT